MVEGKEKEVKEIEQPTQESSSNAEATPSWMDKLGMTAVTAQAEAEAAQRKYEEGVAKTQAQRDAVAKALENKTSVLNAIFEQRKPKYDENKEKRQRQRVVINALGDMLSAAAMGAHAYGKKGAGIVPTPAGGGHLKSLEEISRMQEEYRKKREEWKELGLKLTEAQEDSKVEAAKQLLTQAENREKELAEDAKDAKSTARAAQSDYITAGIQAEDKAEERKWRAEDREDRQQAAADLKAASSGNLSEVLTEDGVIHRLLTDDETSETITSTPVMDFVIGDDGKAVPTTVMKERKAIKPKTYTVAEHNALGKYDYRVSKVKEYMKQGMTMHEAVAKVKSEVK